MFLFVTASLDSPRIQKGFFVSLKSISIFKIVFVVLKETASESRLLTYSLESCLFDPPVVVR